MQYSENDIGIEEINPDKALEYLQKSGGNRKLKNFIIAKYALLMEQGKFPLGDGVIIFNKDGRLRNGFHRLHAVVLSRQTVSFMVRRNADPAEDIVYDSGAVRTPGDAMAFDPDTYKNCQAEYFPIVRMVITDGYSRHERDTSPTTLAEFIDKHKEELDFVYKDCFKGKKGCPKGVSQSSVLAVFLSMVMHGENRQKIKIIAEYLSSNDTTLIKNIPGYQSLSKLRDYLITGKVTSAGGSGRNEIFNKTQNMLNLFMRGENRDKVRKCVSKLPYPCLDYVNLPKLEIDPQFRGYLIMICKEFNLNEKVSAKSIAEKMISKGYRIPNAKNLVNTISKRISSSINKANFVLDLGDIKLIGMKNENSSRVIGYRFVANDHNPDCESFDENEFIEDARRAS